MNFFKKVFTTLSIIFSLNIFFYVNTYAIANVINDTVKETASATSAEK
jgi:hypothetical protein